jgi:hypothetical protein
MAAGGICLRLGEASSSVSPPPIPFLYNFPRVHPQVTRESALLHRQSRQEFSRCDPLPGRSPRPRLTACSRAACALSRHLRNRRIRRAPPCGARPAPRGRALPRAQRLPWSAARPPRGSRRCFGGSEERGQVAAMGGGEASAWRWQTVSRRLSIGGGSAASGEVAEEALPYWVAAVFGEQHRIFV